jgi:hypothetical protein
VGGEGVGVGGEITQALYVHMNNKIKKINMNRTEKKFFLGDILNCLNQFNIFLIFLKYFLSFKDKI